MQKVHDLKTVVIDGIAINYFFKREKNDINGNPRFRVYIIDPDGSAIYEAVFKCYDSQVKEYVTNFIKEGVAAC